MNLDVIKITGAEGVKEQIISCINSQIQKVVKIDVDDTIFIAE